MKKEHKNYIILILTILLVVFLTTGFSNTFGSDTDWINQHIVIPEYFRQMFYETGSLLPNFALNYGGGQNIFNLSYYGLLSPVILPSYLLPFLSMTAYITIVNIIILISSAVLFYKWLKSHNYNDNICLITSLVFILACPLIFHMHRHIMFVNYMPFLIMSLLGVDKLLKDNNKSFLIVSIFLMIMTSYYYSVCGILVVCIYYLYEYLNKNKNLKIKKLFLDGFKFIGLILISICMSSILLLPTAYTLLSGRGESTSSINLLSLFIPYLKVHKIFCGTYAIGMSMIAFISLLYLFFTKKRNNIVLASFISIILFIPIFRYILNGGLYLREKCFIPFIPLLGFITAYFINDLFKNKINIKKFIIYLLLINIPLYFFNQKTDCYLFLLGFILILLIFKNKKKFLITIYILGFSLINVIRESSKEDVVSIEMYTKYFNKEIENNINEIIKQDDDYFRMINLMYPTKTVNKIYNSKYYTTSMYSSTYNDNYLNFIRSTFKPNMIEYNNFLVPSYDNLLFNTFMGVKYVISDYDIGLGYEKINENTYVNNNAFPMIYATNNILNEQEFDNYNYPYQTELLLKNVIINNKESNNKKDNTIKKINLDYEMIENSGVDISKENNSYILNVKNKGYITLRLKEKLENKLLFISLDGLRENSCNIDNISMKINNIENILTCKSWIYPNKNNTFRYLIQDKEIQELKIELSKGKYNINNIETYLLDYNEIKNLNKFLDEFKINDIKNDTIKGTIDVTKDNSYLVTTIPYDEGFTIKVNNKEIEYEKINKGFIGFPIDKGNNNITISYHSPWLKEGIIVSLIGIFIFIPFLIKDIKKKNYK